MLNNDDHINAKMINTVITMVSFVVCDIVLYFSFD